MGLEKVRWKSQEVPRRGETTATMTERVPGVVPGKAGIRHWMMLTMLTRGKSRCLAGMVKTIPIHLLYLILAHPIHI